MKKLSIITSVGLCALIIVTLIFSAVPSVNALTGKNNIINSLEKAGYSFDQGIAFCSLGDGNARVAFYYGNEEHAVIPSVIHGMTVTELCTGYDFMTSSTNTKSLTIPETVKVMYMMRFTDCDALETIYFNAVNCRAEYTFNGFVGGNINNIVVGSAVERIPSCFYASYRQPDITVPEGIRQIDSRAFYRSETLHSVTISGTVETIGKECFYDCSHLESVTIGKGAGEIGEKCFTWCTALEDVRLNGGTSIGDYAFQTCTSLQSVSLPESMKQIGSDAFYACDKLQKIELNEGLEIIGDRAFMADRALTEAKLPSTLKSIGDSAFFETGISEAVIPEGIEEIKTAAFFRCLNLERVSLPDTLTRFGGGSCFAYCPKLERFDFPKAMTVVEAGILSSCDNLREVTFGDAVTEIYMTAFSGCSSLETLALPESVTTIHASAFKDCTSLREINIPSGVTFIGKQAFQGCQSLKQITLPENLTVLSDNVFYNCTALEKIEGTDRILTANAGAVSHTAWYQAQPDGFVYVGKALYDYKGTMPEQTALAVKDGTCSISPKAFQNRTTLVSVTMPDTVEVVGAYAFDGCAGLETVRFSESLQSIESYAFRKTALKEAMLPDSVRTIGEKAFMNCEKLGMVRAPKYLPTLNGIFSNCNQLSRVMGYVGSSGQRFAQSGVQKQFIPLAQDGMPVRKNDVNADGNIDITDATALQQHIAERLTIDKSVLAYAIFNHQDTPDEAAAQTVDISYVTAIQRTIAELDESK
ncbi:MAG: leucine-rich repeat protein [Ruminococcus sp.]|nr:leucine-rich repeat protein [Ruminococcus sp.]